MLLCQLERKRPLSVVDGGRDRPTYGLLLLRLIHDGNRPRCMQPAAIVKGSRLDDGAELINAGLSEEPTELRGACLPERYELLDVIAAVRGGHRGSNLF